jgi:hypothetical protein
MSTIAQQIESLRQYIATRYQPDLEDVYEARLAVCQVGELFDLDFFGESFDEPIDKLLELVAQPQIAPAIRTFILRGPDEGANGTNNWNLEPLLVHGATFSHLESFSVQLTQPGEHNRRIIGEDYEEGGFIGRLLERAPALRRLALPSAPAANFFAVAEHPLEHLNIDAGYDTQAFIRNLAESKCFPELSSLEWGEYSERYIENYQEQCTPFADYQALFASPIFASVRQFVWRNPVCSLAEIQQLKALRPNLQLLLVRATDEYVR